MSGMSEFWERLSPFRDLDENRFAVKPSPESHFSWLRTAMSLERTMMSWVRTGASLIGFGFTIVQFFERFAVNVAQFVCA